MIKKKASGFAHSRIPTGVLSVLEESFHVFVGSHCFFAAAALAYFALLSLIPFFILAASLMGFVFAGVDVAEAYGVITENAERFLPFLRGDLEIQLRELVEARTVTGLIGLVSLTATAAMFFLTVEQAFSAIFPGSAVRSFWRSKGLAVALIPMAVALLGILHYAFLVADMVVGGMAVPFLAGIVESALIDQSISTVILAIEFWLVIYWFERDRIRPYDIAVGAIVFSVLWFVARVGFTFYVQRISSFSIIYGSLGALVVLVLWVYYAAIVFMVGCCVTEALRRRHAA